MTTLPEPVCPLGYPRSQLEEFLGDRLEAFTEWMRGQTVVICQGKRWSPEERRDVPTDCFGHPHNVVTYRHDVERYLAGKEPLD